MTYLSALDRRSERESAEDRLVGQATDWVESVLPGLRKCKWCRQSVTRHSLEALARCEAAARAKMDRYRAGPARIVDLVGGLP